jgi:hypothetical protein
VLNFSAGILRPLGEKMKRAAQSSSLTVAACSIAVLAILPVSKSHAAESAAGAYLLGLRGAGAGITPPEGLYLSSQTFFYNGSISGNVPFEGAQIAGRARVAPIVNVPTLLWSTPVEIGGARLGLSATVPFGRMDVSGVLGPVQLNDTIFTAGDPSFGAFLGWRTGQFHWQIGVTGFLPWGDYHRGALANVAKHRGALDAYGAVTWLDPVLGLDITNVVGITFNAANTATDYRTGTEFHWEWAVTRKLQNGFSFGAVGYVYRQLTDDTGRGALLGPFRGRVAAIGPTIGYDFLVGRLPVSTRLRVYREFETENRLQGTAGFLSLSMPLWVANQPR